MVDSWVIATAIATAIAVASGILIPLFHSRRAKVSKELDLIRDILKNKNELEKRRLDAENKQDSDKENAGSYRAEINDAYMYIVNQWDEFFFQIDSKRITNKKLICQYLSLYKEDVRRAKEHIYIDFDQRIINLMEKWKLCFENDRGIIRCIYRWLWLNFP